MNYFDYLPLVIGGIALGVAAIYMRRTNEEGFAPRFRNREIMTPDEMDMFNLLRRALPDHHIFPKIATCSVICMKEGTGNKEWADRLNRHVCDFAIYTRRMKLECIVELDKNAYRAGTDLLRDALSDSTRIKVWRFDPANKPTEDQINLLVLGHYGPAPDTVPETVVNMTAFQPQLNRA